ncbi:hypothetical protein M9H77_28937 [Catharanthus roseus]|uniref:Uncharacterized protein n=1 Tax=Catharanthus roseus TaxID=4058 RepID=A0ACC0AH46_CATRO|nr:hypothetical protein M9H77_28937 [Catharanthus roseus]
MAGAAASSDAANVDSYIGSFICLISKSEIRYEGFMFHLDPKECTIGLRNVKSFGTENRRRDGPQIPPSERIYEYIYFRGKDIKDGISIDLRMKIGKVCRGH